jgi:hypothetical protein
MKATHLAAGNELFRTGQRATGIPIEKASAKPTAELRWIQSSWFAPWRGDGKTQISKSPAREGMAGLLGTTNLGKRYNWLRAC